jgi:protein-S-isoprenylcysteine O-methyltransferase Ste14
MLWILTRSCLYSLIAAGVAVFWIPLKWFERRAHWPAEWGGLQWIGATAILAGAIVYAYALWLFAARGRGTPLFFDPTRKLVWRGLYKWVRNPMYLALAAVIGGEGLFLRSWHIGVYWVCVVCSLHLLVRLHEENVLRDRFGAVYEDYKRSVPRWLPRKPRPMLETVQPFETGKR